MDAIHHMREQWRIYGETTCHAPLGTKKICTVLVTETLTFMR